MSIVIEKNSKKI